MKTYMELSLVGDKEEFEAFKNNVKRYCRGDWAFTKDERLLRDYLLFDYTGNEADAAEVSIIYGNDTWRQGYIKVTNIVPLEKSQLSVEEYNDVLKLFYRDIIEPYGIDHSELKIVGPTSEKFDPLTCITQEALDKLTLFCNAANKSTGSSHPSDEERWYDFVCQTVDDGRTFDYSTLKDFLMDIDYWGQKDKNFFGSMGRFAWDEEQAEELASEYEQYTSILEYYKRTRNV